MSTLFLDYDSMGDVELILERKEEPSSAEDPEQNSEDATVMEFDVGLLTLELKKLCLRVSSEKLTSSSHYFQAMFKESRFRESADLKTNGNTKINLSWPEHDPSAITIIMGILHGSSVTLPDQVDLPMLENIATLVDKYDLRNDVTPHATEWAEDLLRREKLPKDFNDRLFPWLWISWVFGLKKHFRKLSQVAQRYSEGPIDLTDPSIRLPERVVEAINDQRKIAINEVEQELRELELNLKVEDNSIRSGSQGKLDFMSRCVLLGFVGLQIERFGFEQPDHSGISVRWLEKSIECMPDMTNYLFKESSSRWNCATLSRGTVKGILSKCIEDLKIDEWGLDYDDFKPSPVRNDPEGD